jgi:class III poly(R)-hydroxyalkanoic acid synthase PhaC subunit
MVTQEFLVEVDPAKAFKAYFEWCSKLYDFSRRYNQVLFDSANDSMLSYFNSSKRSINPEESLKYMSREFDSSLLKKLRSKDISEGLAKAVDSWLDLLRISRLDKSVTAWTNVVAASREAVEPMRDYLDRTPSSCIRIEGGFDLHHYKSKEIKHKTPILVVSSIISRHYILDLSPEASVVNNFVKDGFDVFLTDWGTNEPFQEDLDYIQNAVDKIKEITGSDKVTLLGYCWGGIFSLAYTALHPEDVKNLILLSTPVDSSGSEAILDSWTAQINADKLVDTLGDVPDWFINIAFLMRNPAATLMKYPVFFSKPRGWDEIQKFALMETWLNDGRPIEGPVYRGVVNQICKDNLLVKNKARIKNNIIDLQKITVPLMVIVGQNDDLVPPQSSTPILENIGSKDKKLIEFPSGHVGLCVSKSAHQKVWPEVSKWLEERS